MQQRPVCEQACAKLLKPVGKDTLWSEFSRNYAKRTHLSQDLGAPQFAQPDSSLFLILPFTAGANGLPHG